jgi:hypothetical protein
LFLARNREDRAKDEDLIVMAIRHILNDKAVPTKLGSKTPHIAAIFVSDTNRRLREDRGYNGFSGISARTAPVPAALTARDGDRTIKPQKRWRIDRAK